MARIIWDQDGERLYETGVSNCVVYPDKITDEGADKGGFKNGVAWNGITNISESPSGAEASPIYADNIKYLNLISAEELAASVEAYTYPDEFAILDGTQAVVEGVYVGQQTRKTFGLCYKTLIGNDTDNTDHGYKLHLIYNCIAAPSEKAYATVNDSPEAISFSWELSTTPMAVGGDGSYKASATVTIDSTKTDATKLKTFEDTLYGTEEKEPTLPPISAVIDHFKTEG